MTNQLDAASGNFRQLWGAVNDFLHPAPPPVVHIAGWATTVSDYFISKVSVIKVQAMRVAAKCDRTS